MTIKDDMILSPTVCTESLFVRLAIDAWCVDVVCEVSVTYRNNVIKEKERESYICRWPELYMAVLIQQCYSMRFLSALKYIVFKINSYDCYVATTVINSK